MTANRHPRPHSATAAGPPTVFALLRRQRALLELAIVALALGLGLSSIISAAESSRDATQETLAAVHYAGLLERTGPGYAAVYDPENDSSTARIIPESRAKEARREIQRRNDSRSRDDAWYYIQKRGESLYDKTEVLTRSDLQSRLSSTLWERRMSDLAESVRWLGVVVSVVLLLASLSLLNARRRTTATYELATWRAGTIVRAYALLALATLVTAGACAAVFLDWFDAASDNKLDAIERLLACGMTTVAGTCLLAYATCLYKGARALTALPEVALPTAAMASGILKPIKRMRLRRQIGALEQHLAALRRVSPEDPALRERAAEVEAMREAVGALEAPTAHAMARPVLTRLAEAYRDRDELARAGGAAELIASAEGKTATIRGELVSSTVSNAHSTSPDTGYFVAPGLGEGWGGSAEAIGPDAPGAARVAVWLASTGLATRTIGAVRRRWKLLIAGVLLYIGYGVAVAITGGVLWLGPRLLAVLSLSDVGPVLGAIASLSGVVERLIFVGAMLHFWARALRGAPRRYTGTVVGAGLGVLAIILSVGAAISPAPVFLHLGLAGLVALPYLLSKLPSSKLPLPSLLRSILEEGETRQPPTVEVVVTPASQAIIEQGRSDEVESEEQV